ncbi:MAG: helix-turn-helix domain-containing protein, partial [Gammaproteobacteria bacterium]
MSANGYSNTAIAEGLGISAPTVSLWRRRFLAHRIVGICSTQSPASSGAPFSSAISKGEDSRSDRPTYKSFTRDAALGCGVGRAVFDAAQVAPKGLAIGLDLSLSKIA